MRTLVIKNKKLLNLIVNLSWLFIGDIYVTAKKPKTLTSQKAKRVSHVKVISQLPNCQNSTYYAAFVLGISFVQRDFLEFYVSRICMEQFCVDPAVESVRRPVWQRSPQTKAKLPNLAKRKKLQRILIRSRLAGGQSRKCLHSLGKSATYTAAH